MIPVRYSEGPLYRTYAIPTLTHNSNLNSSIIRRVWRHFGPESTVMSQTKVNGWVTRCVILQYNLIHRWHMELMFWQVGWNDQII